MSRGLALVAAALVAFPGAPRADGLFDRVTKKLRPAASRLLPKSDGPGETLDPASDALCDSLDRSYAASETMKELAANQLKCKVVNCAWEDVLPADTAHLDPWLREYSKRHLWLPLAFEASIGDKFLEDQRREGMILERGEPRADRLYARIDRALESARRAYPAIDYDVQVHVVDVPDQVNAQASPGGHVFVTRAAAKDLDDDALLLVLGHEVAHLAKRHTSKQFQQRLVETEQGVAIFKSTVLSPGSSLSDSKGVLDRLGCSFARYDRDQEAQADACAARAMVAADREPVDAWRDYLRARGTQAVTPAAGTENKRDACFEKMASHPEDRSREETLRNAARHHRDASASKR